MAEPVKFTHVEWKYARQQCRTNLIYLCRLVLGFPDVLKHVHKPMVDALQKFQGGTEGCDQIASNRWRVIPGSYKPFVSMYDLKGPRERLVLIPRGHLKSTICTVAHTIQWIINFPDVRILLSSGTGGQVEGFLRAIKTHFQTNGMFRYLFPEFCPPANKIKDFGNASMFTVPNRTLIRPEPTVAVTSVGSVVAGAHYDIIKHDDLVDKENVRTPEQIENVKIHYGFLDPLIQRVTRPKDLPPDEPYALRGWTDVIGTRYDYSEIYGLLLDAETKRIEEGKPEWGILVQSAVVEGDLSDPKNCKTLWPERYPPEELLRIAEDPTRGWSHLAANYLMDPRPDSAGLVDSVDQIVWVPKDAMNKLYAYLNLHVTIDLAGMEPSTNKLADNDYTVINLHGFGHDGTLYIVSIMRGRYTPFEVIDKLFMLAQLHPRIMDFKVEKEAHARVLLPFLKREMEKRQRFIPIAEIRRDNRTSKQQRIKGLQPWFQSGHIKFQDGQPHKLAIIDEIMRFPKYSHDDILDTIADAMQNREGGVISDVLPMAHNGNIPQDPNRPVPAEIATWARMFPEPKDEQYKNLDPDTGW